MLDRDIAVKIENALSNVLRDLTDISNYLYEIDPDHPFLDEMVSAMTDLEFIPTETSPRDVRYVIQFQNNDGRWQDSHDPFFRSLKVRKESAGLSDVGTLPAPDRRTARVKTSQD